MLSHIFSKYLGFALAAALTAAIPAFVAIDGAPTSSQAQAPGG